MPSWQDLLAPSTMLGVSLGGINPLDGSQTSNGSGVISTGFGANKFVELGRRGLAAYRAFQGFPVHPAFDVSVAGQADDDELAKMIAEHGAIPADSDLGQLAVAAGARTYKQRVKFSDGSRATIDVVQVGSRRGNAPEDAPRRSRKNLTSYRLGTASWVIRKLHAQQKLGRRLASLASRLYPKRGKKGRRR